MNYSQIIIRALEFYINERQHCADVREAEGDEESCPLFTLEATEARIALSRIEQYE